MLPGEIALPEEIFTCAGEIVNQLFEYLRSAYDRDFSCSYAHILKSFQIQWVLRMKGQLCCPRCSSTMLIRKGWRRRVLRTSRGAIHLEILQVRCKRCGRTFRPANEILGLPFKCRFTSELVQKAIGLGIQIPFARSSWIMKSLLADAPSAESLRCKIAERAAEIVPCQDVSNKTVLVDSSRVKSGFNPRGSAVYLAVTACKGPIIAGRPTIDKRLIHLHVGTSEPLRTRLLELPIKRLVHDGGMNMESCAKHVQRCRWHLIHQLGHFLWRDGISVKARRRYQKRLRCILWDSPQHGSRRLQQFIKELDKAGLRTAAEHLRQAYDEAFTHEQSRGFAFTTTAPLEREMRELNRRADVGSRWSDQGIENVLKVLFHYRLNEIPLVPLRACQ
jgi:hypothetical protein